MDQRLPEWSELLDPHMTAVLVVDVQKWFTRARPAPMFPPLEGVLPRLQRFVDRAADAGVLIIRIQNVIPEETYSEVWRRQFRAGWGASPRSPQRSRGPSSTPASSRGWASSTSPSIATARSSGPRWTPSCARGASAR